MIEARGSIRILHVDDDPDFADLAATFLERKDDRFSVETATSVDEGLDHLSDTDFDCIVSDYDMPGRSGVEFLEAVRGRDSEVPFLLFTGKGSEEVASDAISAGATDYLQKEPGTDKYELLANRIRNAVAQRQSERTQQWLLEIAENTDRVLYSFSADWSELLFVSSAYEEIWGRSVADLHEDPTDFLNGIHPDDRQRVRDAMETVSADGVADIEYRVNAEEDYGRWVRAHSEPITDETGTVIRAVGFAADITEKRRRRERHERQRETLVDLATDEAVTSGEFDTAVERITEAAADVLDVERVNVWLADDDGGGTFDCIDNYARRTDEHTDDMSLVSDAYPSYFGALEHQQAIDVDDARSDQRTAELVDDYLEEHDVGALLDGVVRMEGEVVGVICHEHVGGPREWTDDEIDFSGDIADIIGRALRNRERREREGELELKTTAMDEAPIGITIAGPSSEDTALVYANERFEALTGYSESEILGRNCRFLQGEGTDSEPVARIREAIDAEESVSVVLRNYRKDGTEFWNRVSIAPVRSDAEAETNYIGFQTDVSDRVERETTLETLHSAATDIQTCETLETAAERTVEAAETVLDFEMCSVMLHDGEDHLEPIAMSSGAPPDGARRMADDEGLVGKTYQGGDSYVVGEVTPDDETDPAKESYRSGMSIPVGDHGVFQAVATVPNAFNDTDLTFAELLLAHTARTLDRIQFEDELRESQEALQRRNDRLQRFAGLVSHDLRNPLNVASGQLALARADCDDEHLDSVARAHDRMAELIDHLLTLARKGNPVEELEAVDPGTVADRCWQNVATAEATLRIESEDEFLAEPGRLQQLFENLMRNSVEHGSTSPDPQARQDSRQASASEPSVADVPEDADHGVTITVGDLEDGFYLADDGPGIPADEREDVLEYGYSSDSTGTGFGLAIVKEIVEAHGWSVAVTDSESGGARFEITGVERP